MANECVNSYSMAFCACCRQIYKKDVNWGFPSKEEAEKYYQKESKVEVVAAGTQTEEEKKEETKAGRGNAQLEN